MRVYHSSTLEIPYPDTVHSRQYLDFGKGFYLTTLQEQALLYAQRFLRLRKEAWLNVYELREDLSCWKVLRFESYNEQWLDFIVRNRRGERVEDYDMVVGGIADDKVFRTIDLYLSGDMTKADALKRLTYEKPNIQLCIRSEAMLRENLTFIESIKL